MNYFVVDTNVAVVANLRTPQAGPDCVLACIDILETIVRSGNVVLDAEMDVLSEYMRQLSMAGQPGTGDAFMQWVWQHQADVTRCERVRLTPHTDRTYAEFPEDAGLASFDPNDRKFVAVALASRNHPEVLNAVDSDWWDHTGPLERNGVRIKNLCPKQFATT
jgi:hypothetical protein